MQPVIRITFLRITIFKQIHSTKYRSSSKMPRIHRHNERVLAVLLSEVLSNGFCVG